MLDLGDYDQHRRHPRLGRLAPLQQGCRGRAANRGSWPSCRRAGRPWTTLAAPPCCESLAVVAYQTLHTLREHFLSGSLRTAQPKQLRNWLFQLPAKLTTHARKDYLQFLRREPIRSRLLTALRGLSRAIPPTCARPKLSSRHIPRVANERFSHPSLATDETPVLRHYFGAAEGCFQSPATLRPCLPHARRRPESGRLVGSGSKNRSGSIYFLA